MNGQSKHPELAMAILHNNGKRALYADPGRRSIEVQIPDAAGYKLLFDFDT